MAEDLQLETAGQQTRPVLERIAEQYDQDTAARVQTFYSNDSYPGDTVEETVAAIGRRLHRIYPEEHLSTLFDVDSLNHVYSAMREGEAEPGCESISAEFYTKPYENDAAADIDAVVFDHSVIGDVAYQRNRESTEYLGAEDVDEAVQRVDDFTDRPSPHYLYWNDALYTQEAVHAVNAVTDAEIAMLVPEGTKDQLMKKPDFNKDQVEEAFRYLDVDEVALPDEARPVPGFYGAEQDKKIAEATEQENGILVTADKDHLRMEPHFDITVGTTDIVRQLLEERLE